LMREELFDAEERVRELKKKLKLNP